MPLYYHVQRRGASLKVGKSYAARKAISYAAFREFGVPADILKRAGVSRSGS